MSRMHHYEGESIIVEFDLSRCIHTGDCTRGLPEVFDTHRRGRWVHPDAADAAEVARICAACPTGALRCIDKAEGELMHAPPAQHSIQIVADGPLYVHADMYIDDRPETAYRVALCRCGKSRLMPFCDESHREGFRNAGKVPLVMPDQAPAADILCITTHAHGPLTIEGTFTLLDSEAHTVCQSNRASLCSCGKSNIKPYCDGSHALNDNRSESI
ncbi:MAG: hypothetical protein CO186_01460 [Zetaproteobacteria bacterium CG_4_9_14_3_um_filter_49_83]|nr:MAG: hypothetical protein AUJ56_02790 [Zetaproteobacteria bacterium CG1_02_49_23]PIQ30117.1 MAG: hypothetical protein COW62_14035 [Zetaproteobacteria bacterium CG17_big_fil_post_rev_8_21_14_2_50_50_13]PIV31513.1 MAG: hypothetical protein COS35_00850 [Zetaproteobacteria bacterium CG02_land_8_20_14_3_00_50_9]PIY55935.1 MAG: hypothetical protein COZ00_06240 [Zetaproteobacteria bacterium CG_4_10_14_0_8_um_filter_49_80]PJA36388.1 MAG: hypothetical protein CO186_01460 [Zetaproteobacteria bacterium